MRLRVLALTAGLGSMVLAELALAQPTPASDAQPAPDKGGYMLFDPTPVGQMRSYCTDRPTKSNLPCIVDAGHFQYEADAFNWTYSHVGVVTADIYLYTNPTFKLGLTNRIDIELNIAPGERVTTHGPGFKSDLTGLGDLFLRSKLNLISPEGGDVQATLLPYIKIPTARAGIGNKVVEGGLIVPVSFALPNDLTLLFDPEADLLRNTISSGRHANFQMLANVSHSLWSDNVTGYAELWGDINPDPAGTVRQASLDLAVCCVVGPSLPNLQFDPGINNGPTHATPRVQAYAGISQRF